MEAPTFSVVTSTSAEALTTEILAGTHVSYADETKELGGEDKGPSPYDILLSALGACTGMTLRLYAKRKGMPLEKTTVYLRHYKIYVQDCIDCEVGSNKLDCVDVEIELTGNLTDDDRARLLDIAHKCPVHKTLLSGIRIETTLRAIS